MAEANTTEQVEPVKDSGASDPKDVLIARLKRALAYEAMNDHVMGYREDGDVFCLPEDLRPGIVAFLQANLEARALGAPPADDDELIRYKGVNFIVRNAVCDAWCDSPEEEAGEEDMAAGAQRAAR